MNLEKEVFDIALKDIMPNRFQPREVFEDEALSELSTSIKEHGVIQPIIVRKVGDKYEIIAGERRFRASQLAGKETIPALVRDIDDKETAKIALLENLQRKDLSAIEEARTYQTILKLDNMTQEELAANLGKSQSTIANKLRLLNLDESVQTALLNEKISERHARSLLNITDSVKQRELLDRVILNRMTVRALDEEIAKITGKQVITQDEENYNQEQTTTYQNPIMPEIKTEENNFNNIIEKPTASANLFENIIREPVQEPNLPNIPVPEVAEESSIQEDQQPEVKQVNIFESLRVERPTLEESSNTQVSEPSEETPTFTDQELKELENKMFASLRNQPVMEETANVYQNINPIGSIPIQQPTLEQINSDIYDLRFAINNVRQAVQNTKKFGFTIETEEFDFENAYQIIIKIDKNK